MKMVVNGMKMVGNLLISFLNLKNLAHHKVLSVLFKKKNRSKKSIENQYWASYVLQKPIQGKPKYI